MEFGKVFGYLVFKLYYWCIFWYYLRKIWNFVSLLVNLNRAKTDDFPQILEVLSIQRSHKMIFGITATARTSKRR